MARRGIWIGALSVAIVLGWAEARTWGFIEKLTQLSDIIADSDHIFVAKVETIDAAKPSCVLKIGHDLKGKAPYRSMPINLTGDKETHTPQLLKRLAPNLPVIVFVTEIDKKKLSLVYTNGTWFQVLGETDGTDTRWAFTHIEIYLRRTFTGTTVEMEKVLEDALAGKKKPPQANAKEKPGFGPEIEATPSGRPRASNTGSPGVLLGVIALPFVAPIAMLLQLLFPGLLRDQWRNYQIAVSILLSQSTLIFLHFALATWVIASPGEHWWMSDAALWCAVVGLSGVGMLIALVRHLLRSEPLLLKPPVRVEYLALGVLLIGGLAWGAWQWHEDEQPFADAMGIVTAAAFVAVLHLLYRRLRHSGAVERRAILTTELVFLVSLLLVGTGLGMYLHRPAAQNLQAGGVISDWSLARGNESRTGALDANDSGPSNPVVLWTFEPRERRGRITFHSSPTYVDGHIYIGAMHQVQSVARGLLYCINAQDGGRSGEPPIHAGERIWRFTADESLKAVFSTPIISQGKIYVGEGYHQDSECRLFCLDARSGDKELWSKKTTSHVESSPCVVGARVYFGAGDDGLLCVDAGHLIEASGGLKSPSTLWRVPNIHVDASPLVVGDHVFVGTIVGDLHQTLQALAVDANTGDILWKTPAPMAILASPSHEDGRLFFGLGNGKLGKDADQPAGALWCLDAKSGRRLWEYPVGNCVLGTPALMEGNVYFGSTDGWFYCLRQTDGKLIWKIDMQSPIAASPVVAKGKVYVLSTTGVLNCLGARDGKELWRLDNLADGITDAYASPTLAHGRLYVALGGKVLCIGDQ